MSGAKVTSKGRKRCDVCNGAGRIQINHSWFKADGHYFVPCWMGCREPSRTAAEAIAEGK